MKNYICILIAGSFLGLVPAIAPASAQNKLPPGTSLPVDPSTGITPGANAQEPGAGDLAAAETKIDQKDFAAARPLVSKVLQQHPGDARALFDMGYLDETANQQDAAAAAYRKAIAADPKQFESRLALGLILARQGKLDLAREQLEQASQLQPATPNPSAQAQALRALAELDRSSDPAAARTALLAALKLTPETPEDLLLTAQIAAASEDADTAEVAYRRLLTSTPGVSTGTSSAATSGLVQLLLKQQKSSDAEPLLRSALEHDPDDPALNSQLAVALIAQGKDEEALPVLEKLRRQEAEGMDAPFQSSINRMLADAYSRAGHPEKADPIYAQMAAAQPNDPQILAGQGMNLVREQKYEQAQQVLERAVKLKPDDADAWSGLAFAASENRQYPTALQALAMRAKYLPETSSTYFLWAASYDGLHQSKLASEFYRKFLAADAGRFPDEESQAKHRLVALGERR